jgi:hypothetical protein
VSQLAYMSRDGRLPNYVEAYMWLAIVGSSLVPPAPDEVKVVTLHMTKAQIAEGQHRAEDWIKRHTPRSETLAQADK